MTIYHVMGDAFVTRDELNQRAGEILEFAQKSVSGLQFQHGLMTIDNVHTEYLDG